jgi:tripartite-type tricarboxylate transporter receptor subunit TctC
VVPFGPGTGADIFVRYFSTKLGELLGKPVVVVNRPGATGNIASEAVAKARPDGHTIYITPASSTLAAAAHLYKKLPFDPAKDFAPVTTLATLSFALIVDPKRPINTVADLTRVLKEKGDRASYAGSNNTGIIASELYKAAAGLDVTRVAYRQIGDIINDMTNGQVDYTFIDASWVVEQANSGRVRVLAVTGAKRSTALPNVPTMAEAGYPQIELTSWWGVFVPARTPQPIVDRLAGLFNQILAMPETAEFLGRIANEPLPGNAESLRRLLARDLDRWGEYVRIAKIPAQ